MLQQYEFLTLAGRSTYAAKCLAFLVPTEVAAPEFAHVKNKTTVDIFFRDFLQVSSIS